MPYDVGDGVEVRSAFTNLAGAATDPTTITLKVRKPDATISTYTYAAAQLTRESAGVFVKSITLDTSGVWTYRFEGTGAVVAADEELLVVEASSFA
jgi:hypothetical protein